MGVGGGDDGKCEKLLMPWWRGASRTGLDLGQLGISRILLLFFGVGFDGTVLDWSLRA